MPAKSPQFYFDFESNLRFIATDEFARILRHLFVDRIAKTIPSDSKKEVIGFLLDTAYIEDQGKGGNVAAKVQRWADALEHEGVDSAVASKIKTGRQSNEAIASGAAAPGWDNVLDDLQAKGLLPKGEKIPNESIPQLIAELRRRAKSPKAEAPKADPAVELNPNSPMLKNPKAAEIARQLKEMLDK